MKKFFITLLAVMATAVSALAADLTEVWTQIKDNDTFLVAEIPNDSARAQGFEQLTVALNSAPTVSQITDIKSTFGTITPSQKLTSVSQSGVDVNIYTSPATADGSLYNLLLFISKSTGDDKALIVIFGKCTPAQMANALQGMSLEKIIGS